MQLHLDFLRWKSKTKGFTAKEELLFSRRQFLLGGVTTAALNHDLARVLLGRRVEFRHGDGKAAFWLDGIEAWKLDPALFSPGGRLHIDTASRSTVICQLRGLIYPGTDLRVDMEVCVEERALGWICELFLPQFGVKHRIDLVRWLEGTPIHWQNSTEQRILHMKGFAKVVAYGSRVTMSLDHRWKLGINGDLSVTFRGDTARIENGHVLVDLASYSSDFPLALYAGPSSRITLKGKDHLWKTSLVHLLAAPVVRIERHKPLFDRMRIDAWHSRDGLPRAAACFFAGDALYLAGTLHGQMTDAAGDPVQVRLVRAVYSVTTNGGKEESAFMAALDGPTVAYGRSHAITFDDQLEIQHSTAGVCGAKASIGTSKLNVSVSNAQDGAIFEFQLPDGYRVPALHLDHDVSFVERSWDALVELLASAFDHDKFAVSLDAVRLCAVRPEDMLHLQFRFKGLGLRMHAGMPFLERQTAQNGGLATASIKITFPSQSLQEESFFEGTNGEDDPQNPPTIPAQTSAAGPTWLRFKVPPALFKKHNRLPFSMETLLRWKDFTFLPGNRRRPARGSLLEVPYRLFLTPGADPAFQHNVEPSTLVPTYTPALQPPSPRAPELWGTLLHNADNDTADGFDLDPMDMTAFGAADIAELIKVQVIAADTVRGYLSQPIPFPSQLPAPIFLYRGGTTAYLGSNAGATLTRVFSADDGGMAIEYKLAGVNLTPQSQPTEPDVPLWMLPQNITPQTLAGCGPGQASGPIASGDSVPNPTQTGGVTRPPMDAGDRAQIVAITTGGTGSFMGSDSRTKATPLTVNRLQLTALGAYFDTDSHFEDRDVSMMDANIEVRAWRHIMVLGRDSFVEVKYKGFLWPTGHRAQFIKRTQRVFYSVTPTDTDCTKARLFCYLRQQYFVQVKQKTRQYYNVADPTSAEQPPVNPTWDLPFQQVDITTVTTPALADPNNPPPGGTQWVYPAGSCTEWEAFVPQVYDANHHLTDVLFDLEGSDWASPSAEIPFKAPMVFVRSYTNTNMVSADESGISAMYSLPAAQPRNAIQMKDQHIHFAASKAAGDTEQQVGSMTLQGRLLPSNILQNDQFGIYAHFYPFMQSAQVELTPVSKLSGTTTMAQVEFEPTYFKQNGFPAGPPSSANKAEVYLTIDAGPALNFNGQHSGGLATPSIPLQSISRSKGAISMSLAAAQNPSAHDFFPSIDVNHFPKLFGVIPLQDLLYAAGEALPDGFAPFDSTQFPDMLNSLVDGAALVCQNIQSLYDTYYAPLSSAIDILNQLRDLTLKAVIRQLQPVLQNEVQQIVQPQLDAARTQAMASLESAGETLEAKVMAAGGSTAVQQIKNAHDALRQNLDSTINGFVSQAAPMIVAALNNAQLATDAFTQALAMIQETLADSRQAATSVVDNLKSLKTDIARFVADPNLSQVKKGAPDPLTALSNFLKSEMRKELDAAGAIAQSLGISIEQPLQTFDQQFDLAVDSGTDLFVAQFAQAVATIQNPTQDALAQIDAAKAAYQDALTQSEDSINSAIATAEETVSEYIGNAVGAATEAVVGVVFTDTTLQLISTALDAVEEANALIDTFNSYAEQLDDVLNTPVSYGLNYRLPPLPLKESLIFIPNDSSGDQTASFLLSASINASVSLDTILQKQPPTIDYQVIAQVVNFGIGLFGGDDPSSFIKIYCKSIQFTTHNQEHPKVAFALDAPNAVQFGGALEYIQDLEDSFSSLGSNNFGPLIALTDVGIEVGWEFGIPDVLAGGFTMTGLAFSFTVDMPFNGDPLGVRFYFARPEKHFCISAGIYGGGGYFMLEGGPAPSQPGSGAIAQIRAFQLCLEFGVTTGIDLGVATGDAKIMAGTYIGVANNICTLTGFVRAAGNLEIIEIVNVALEIYVGVSYVSNGNLQGTGYVSLSISIGFFSVGVTVTMNWTWGGGGGGVGGQAEHMVAAHAAPKLPSAAAKTCSTDDPPRSLNYLTKDRWKAYANAF